MSKCDKSAPAAKKIRKYGDRTRLAIKCKGGLVHQSMKDECNPNKVIKQWMNTGLNPHPHAKRPLAISDLTILPETYDESLNQVFKVQEAFDSLPSAVREKFKNNPYGLLDFLQDPKNAAEAYKLGLLETPFGNDEAPKASKTDSEAEKASDAPTPKEGA